MILIEYIKYSSPLEHMSVNETIRYKGIHWTKICNRIHRMKTQSNRNSMLNAKW